MKKRIFEFFTTPFLVFFNKANRIDILAEHGFKVINKHHDPLVEGTDLAAIYNYIFARTPDNQVA